MAFKSFSMSGAGSPPVPQFGLANQANQFMTGQAAMPFQANLPLYQPMIQGESENILDMIGGEIPDDVINQIMQGAAERGIMTGSPGSPNANAAYLKALGLTSLDLQRQGSERLATAVQRTPIPEIWNPMGLFESQLASQQELDAAKQGEGTGSGMSTPFNWGRPQGTFVTFGGQGSGMMRRR